MFLEFFPYKFSGTPILIVTLDDDDLDGVSYP